MAAPVANAALLVTATSFMRNARLREGLEQSLSLFSHTHSFRIYYLDLREEGQRKQFHDPAFGQAIVGWLVGGETVSDRELSQFPNLDTVSKYGVGIDNIDFSACDARGVRVHFESGVNSLPVAEHTLGLIISLCRNIALNSRKLSTGVWNKDGGRGLHGMKVGIVGLGHVGSKLAGLLKLLGAELAYSDILDKTELESSLGIQRLEFQDIISWAELLSFHVPLTDQTRKMFSEAEVLRVKPGLLLVNTSRGAILDQKALKHGLQSGQIGGLALDVFEKEPLHDRELAESERLVGTPHTAGNSEQAVLAMGEAAIRGIAAIFSK